MSSAPSIDNLTTELEEARQLAVKCKAPAAAVGASLGKAKLNGLIVDKSKAKVVVEDELEEKRRWARQVFKEHFERIDAYFATQPDPREGMSPEELQAMDDWAADYMEATSISILRQWQAGTYREHPWFPLDPIAWAERIAERRVARLSRGRPSTIFIGLTDELITPNPRLF